MMFDNPVYIKSNYNGWGCITSWSGRLSEGTRLPLGGVTAVPDWGRGNVGGRGGGKNFFIVYILFSCHLDPLCFLKR